MAYQGNYPYRSNFRDAESYRRPVSSLFDMGSSSQDTHRSQQSSRPIYQGESYSQSYGGRSEQGGYTERYNSNGGNRRRGGFTEETSQQPSYMPQPKLISNLFDVPSDNKRFEGVPERTYQLNQNRMNQSQNNYRQPESDYQQNYQARENQSGNNYRQPYQANQFGRNRISDMFDVPSDSNTFGGQYSGNNRQTQDQSGSSYISQDHSSGGTFSRDSDFHQGDFAYDSNSQQTSGNHSFRGKFKSTRGQGGKWAHNQKPYKSDNNYDPQTDEDQKDNVLKIDPSLSVKYKKFPPPAEEMGDIFKGFVVFFHWKDPKSVPEKNHFVVICESFRSSDGFGPLEVQDGFQQGNKFTKYCTLRYQGMMMARGVGQTGNLKEPRVMAGVELINRLAMTCYTLKVKHNYFRTTAIPGELTLKEVPGVYRVVPDEEVPDIDAAKKMVSDLVESDSDCELVFTKPSLLHHIKWFSKSKRMGVETRRSKEAVVVCKARTPQYWRDKILASGKMENEKFTLLPPQGLGINLLESIDIEAVVPNLKKYPEVPNEKVDPYGPEVRVQEITVPWEKKGYLQKVRSNISKRVRKNRGKKRK